MTYPDGEIVTTNYNNNMQPTDVSGAGNYVPSMTYDSAGRLLTRALGNGLTQSFNYYAWNQQGGRLHTLVTGSLQNLTYQYDAVGNITQIVNSVASETSAYQYDELDRLRFWTLNGVTEEYSYDAQGNLDVKNGLDLNYNDADHKHAVTHIGSTQKYWYDDNGNQITRIVGADTFTLTYDAENRLVEVKKNSVTISQFTYDGDGKRVKSVIDGEVTRFVGGYYERKGSEITKYYMAGASRVAIRKYTIPQSMTVEYMLGDHLGSTSITTDANGVKVSEMRYKPWGEVRYSWTDPNLNTTPTYELPKYTFTNQYSYVTDFGLMYYGARFYDSAVGRFVSADTVTPEGVQGFDRYAYGNNSPVRYADPSGHEATPAEYSEPEECLTFSCVYNITFTGEWTVAHIIAVMKAVILVGTKFAESVGGGITHSDAFNEVYGNINFTWGGEGAGGMCADPSITDGGCTTNAHQINFWGMSGDSADNMERRVKNVVHELGHAYDHVFLDNTGARASSSNRFANLRERILRPNPACDDCFDWQQSRDRTATETFADMFIAWTYNAWNTDPLNVDLVGDAQAWMNGVMP